jgi:hypothetical protein
MHRSFVGALAGALLFIGGSMIPATAMAQRDAAAPVEVIFTPDMTKDDLLRIQKEVHASGVKLVYEAMDFKQGKLHELAILVKTPQGEGTAKIAELTVEKPFGFHYDPSPKAEVPFSIGCITPTPR